MKFSLLYRDAENVPTAVMEPSVLYDLSFDRMIRMISDDVRRSDYFLGVAAKPLCAVEDIVYRQQILSDFRDIPKLYDDVKLIFNRYDKVKIDWQELRAAAYPATSAKNYRALLEYTFASLKVTSMFPKTIISFFRSIQETLEKYEMRADGLIRMRDYCREMAENDSLNELAVIAANFQYYTPEQYNFSILTELDDTLCLCACELCGITEIGEKGNENVFKRIFRFKKQADDGAVAVPSDEDTANDAIYLLNEALHHIDTTLTQVTGAVYDIFYGISQELYFYDTALACMAYAAEHQLPLCFASLSAPEQDTLRLEGVCDMLLVCEGKPAGELTPNSLRMTADCDGAVIRGLNKSGKTSFLRAVAVAQIMTQAGLPVCAKKAEISVKNGIFSHFSSAEEEFKAGDTAGRFEGEVQAVARIVDALRPYSVLYLNETFQTTSYTEGADGIYHILRALPAARTKYLFVTKLTRLPERLHADAPVLLLETGNEPLPYKAVAV